MAAVITFLSSEDASYLTGTTIDINACDRMPGPFSRMGEPPANADTARTSVVARSG